MLTSIFTGSEISSKEEPEDGCGPEKELSAWVHRYHVPTCECVEGRLLGWWEGASHPRASFVFLYFQQRPSDPNHAGLGCGGWHFSLCILSLLPRSLLCQTESHQTSPPAQACPQKVDGTWQPSIWSSSMGIGQLGQSPCSQFTWAVLA